MSLLMDALKRAEASKKEAQRAAASGQESPAPGSTGLSLEPLPGTGAAGKSLPELADHIAALDAELAVSSQPEAAARRPAPPKTAVNGEPAAAAEADKQAAARNAFAAKIAARPSQRPLWLVLGTLGVAAVGIGVYVWIQVQSMGGSSLAPVAAGSQPRPPQPPPAPAAGALPPASSPALAVAPVQPDPARISGSTAGEAPPLAARTGALRPAPGTADVPPGRGARAATTGTAAADPAPIRLTRSQPEPDPNAQAGYAKLQGNQLDAARHDYELALKSDPNNGDALLALAAIAQRQGRPADAARYQQRALEADPQNAAAQAALLGGSPGGDLTGNESRLKNLLAAQPESGALNFALGNLYSRQGRWSEAQQVYFNAVAADPDNPDYLFNLAVSLDHLRQAKVAAQHYRLALEAAQRRPPAFDPARARARLAELAPPGDPR